MKFAHLLFTAIICATALVPAHSAPVNEIIVEALIDGDTELHVRPESVSWETGGASYKPGKWNGQDQPTYINGIAWVPRWKNEKDPKAKDKTAPYPITLNSTDLEFELLAVTEQHGGTGILIRSAVTAKKEGGHYVVRIPDPEGGACWYKIAIRKKKP